MAQATTLMPEGRQRYYNNDGTPCAGGQLWTYAAGTTNPKTTYADADGTTPHPNPVTLDTHGEAVIYWSGAYRVDLKQADGQQVTGYPVDNIKTDPAGTWGLLADVLGRFAANTGAALVGFLQRGVGAIKRTVQDKLRESISVTDFGASPAASAAVNTAAFNAAALAVLQTGDGFRTPTAGRIRVPNGLYEVNGEIGLYNGTYLDGESAGGVVLEQQDPTKRTLYNVDAVTGVDNALTIKRVIVSYAAQATDPAAIGVDLTSTTAISPVLEDVTVFQAYHAFRFERTINLVQNRCYAINSTMDGFWYEDSNDGAHNSAAVVNACYAAGCGRWGYSGALIGSALRGVAADRCETGFHLTLLNTGIQGSTEMCATRGVHILNGSAYSVEMYITGAEGATDAIWLMDSPYGTVANTTTEWGGGGAGYTIRTSGTTANILVDNCHLARYGTDFYSDSSIITTRGGSLQLGAVVTPNPPLSVGVIPKPGHGAVTAKFSSGAGGGAAGADGGFRVAGPNGYGISMQAWDDTFPRQGLFAHGGEQETCLFEGSYPSLNYHFHIGICLQSGDGLWHRIQVANDGTLSTVTVPGP